MKVLSPISLTNLWFGCELQQDFLVHHHVRHLKKVMSWNIPWNNDRYVTVAAGASGKILFVVPTEPLVWQVAALFNKLLKGQVGRLNDIEC